MIGVKVMLGVRVILCRVKVGVRVILCRFMVGTKVRVLRLFILLLIHFLPHLCTLGCTFSSHCM